MDNVGQSFPRRARLRKGTEFRWVMERAIKVHLDGFTLYARKTSSMNARLGVAVSRRVCKKAVVRNRIKRLVRESFRKHLQTLPGADLVAVAKPSLIGLDNGQIVAQLDQGWAKLTQRCAN